MKDKVFNSAYTLENGHEIRISRQKKEEILGK